MNQAVASTASRATLDGRPKTRRGRAIQRALPILGSAVARQCGVEVIYGADSPHRIGKTIYLPNLPFDDPDIEVVAIAYLLHEAAHIRYHDGEAVTRTALQEAVRNIMQDVLDERRLGGDYPGFKVRLAELVERLRKTGEFQAPSAQDSPVAKLQKYLLYRLRAVLVGQSALAEYAEQAESVFREAFPPGACVRISSAMGRLAQMKTRQDVADLAQEIVEIIDAESQEPPPPPAPMPQLAGSPSESGEGASEEGGEDGEADACAADSPSVGEGAPPSASGGAPGEQAESGAGKVGTNDSGAPANETAPSDAEQTGTPEQRAQLRSILAAQGSDFGPDLSQVLEHALGQAVRDAAATGEADGAGQAGGVGRAQTVRSVPNLDPAAVLQEVREATMALRTRLAGLIAASREERGGYGRRGHRIEPRRLIGALQGDPNIFRQRRITEAPNTAVLFLGDRSTSMAANDRLVEALQAIGETTGALEALPTSMALASILNAWRAVATQLGAIAQEDESRPDDPRFAPIVNAARACASSFRGLAVPSGLPDPATWQAVEASMVRAIEALAGVDGRNRLHVTMDSAIAVGAALSAIEGVAWSSAIFPGVESDVEVLTGFTERVEHTAHRYRGVGPDGGTPLVPAMLWAIDALLARPEPRRILLVATDGQPSEEALCREIAERCWEGGIEAYGIGIRVPDVSKIFPRSRAIADQGELAPALFDLLQEVLL